MIINLFRYGNMSPLKFTRHLTRLDILLIVARPVPARPFAVRTDIAIRHGNRYPLPAEDMEAAASREPAGLMRLERPPLREEGLRAAHPPPAWP